MIDVVYIAGAGRSGSTVIDRVLGTLDGVTSLNEAHRIWEHGSKNELCSCGRHFDDCPFWQGVMSVLREQGIDPARLIDLSTRLDRTRNFGRLLLGAGDTSFRAQVTEYQSMLGALYSALAATAGSRVLIDSSKIPTRALLLAGAPGVRVHALHLVRDARAVVYAWWKRQKLDPGRGAAMRKYSPMRTAFVWTSRNVVCELLRFRLPYTRMHYESFVANPRDEIGRVIEAIAPLRGRSAPFLDDTTIALGSIHTMSGNPDRFKTGPTALHVDSEWMRSFHGTARALTTSIAAPLLWRYGYLSGPALLPDRPSRSGDRPTSG